MILFSIGAEMNRPVSEQLRDLISHAQWDEAAALLQQLDLRATAELLLTLPFEQQRAVFRLFRIDFAAALLPNLPYYDQYVLMHSRPRELRSMIDAMNADDRMRFFDELPEEAWRQLMDELSAEHPGDWQGVERRSAITESAAPESAERMIEARAIEKRFQQPDGHQILVIAATDLTVDTGSIVALLGPSGSGKSTLLRMLAGLSVPSSGEVLWHGKPISECAPNVAIVFQSFALFPWLTVVENVEAPLLAHGMPHKERHRRAIKALHTVGLKGWDLDRSSVMLPIAAISVCCSRRPLSWHSWWSPSTACFGVECTPWPRRATNWIPDAPSTFRTHTLSPRFRLQTLQKPVGRRVLCVMVNYGDLTMQAWQRPPFGCVRFERELPNPGSCPVATRSPVRAPRYSGETTSQAFPVKLSQ